MLKIDQLGTKRVSERSKISVKLSSLRKVFRNHFILPGVFSFFSFPLSFSSSLFFCSISSFLLFFLFLFFILVSSFCSTYFSPLFFFSSSFFLLFLFFFINSFSLISFSFPSLAFNFIEVRREPVEMSRSFLRTVFRNRTKISKI